MNASGQSQEHDCANCMSSYLCALCNRLNEIGTERANQGKKRKYAARCLSVSSEDGSTQQETLRIDHEFLFEVQKSLQQVAIYLTFDDVFRKARFVCSAGMTIAITDLEMIVSNFLTVSEVSRDTRYLDGWHSDPRIVRDQPDGQFNLKPSPGSISIELDSIVDGFLDVDDFVNRCMQRLRRFPYAFNALHAEILKSDTHQTTIGQE